MTLKILKTDCKTYKKSVNDRFFWIIPVICGKILSKTVEIFSPDYQQILKL